jgi:hypothetical protein
MITGQMAYLGLVLAGFTVFMIVLASTHIYVVLGERKERAAAKKAASTPQVGTVVAPPRLAEAVDVGGEVGDLVSVH